MYVRECLCVARWLVRPRGGVYERKRMCTQYLIILIHLKCSTQKLLKALEERTKKKTMQENVGLRAPGRSL